MWSACSYVGPVASTLFCMTDCYRQNAECQIGESEHNASLLESLQRADESGQYLLHDLIPFNGTITAVNASGFCTLINRTDQILALRLLIYRRRAEGRYFNVNAGDPINIEAECENISLTEDEYSLGSVYQDSMDLKVLADDRIAIRFNTQYCDGICTFQPATVNNSNSQFMFFPRGVNINTKNGGQQRHNVSLHFSANILNGKIPKNDFGHV